MVVADACTRGHQLAALDGLALMPYEEPTIEHCAMYTQKGLYNNCELLVKVLQYETYVSNCDGGALHPAACAKIQATVNHHTKYAIRNTQYAIRSI